MRRLTEAVEPTGARFTLFVDATYLFRLFELKADYAALDAEYQQKFDEINDAIIIAVTEGDTELQQELVAEKAALKEEYTQKRGEL